VDARAVINSEASAEVVFKELLFKGKMSSRGLRNAILLFYGGFEDVTKCRTPPSQGLTLRR
jgi:hypothetical protein